MSHMSAQPAGEADVPRCAVHAAYPFTLCAIGKFMRLLVKAGVLLWSTANSVSGREIVDVPEWSTSTVAGTFSWKWDKSTSDTRFQIFLNQKKIHEFLYGPQVMKHFIPGIAPYDELIVLDYYPIGSTFADHGPIRFLELKKNGEYLLSSEVGTYAAGKTLIERKGNRIIIKFPANPGTKNGPDISETWIYEKGKVRRVSP